ncbi:hypothetical protein [Pseudomonas taiwanensis]|uniref:hypothetical protein n=1 Tax=Pseudomonas taiwanensis TaxID=470150 RepID=UPI002117BF86
MGRALGMVAQQALRPAVHGESAGLYHRAAAGMAVSQPNRSTHHVLLEMFYVETDGIRNEWP